eukprot:TRINITY_DN5017_c0_g2_i1.p1 TRINITY_DN5017_c0_g2~~TRINITY_DN5017_c0_g2_i1.p1  ORF type:complete len:240 (+),score=67.39 TRINITY_DN5017_c0_g2_i1:54-722(+)
MLDEDGGATPFVISESTWAGLGPDVKSFLLAARSWACPGPDRMLPGWRHNRPAGAAKDNPKPAKLHGLVLLFQSAKWRAENGFAPMGYRGLDTLWMPRTDEGTRVVLAGLRPKQPPPRWQLDADTDMNTRKMIMASEAQADRAALTLIERTEVIEETEMAKHRTEEADVIAHRRERARQQAEARRAERLVRLQKIEEQEREVNESLKVLSTTTTTTAPTNVP